MRRNLRQNIPKGAKRQPFDMTLQDLEQVPFDPSCHRMFLTRAYWRASILFRVHLCSRTIQHEHLVLPNLLYCRNGFYKNKRRLDLGILHLRYELVDHLLLLKISFKFWLIKGQFGVISGHFLISTSFCHITSINEIV